jgi:Tol biopolymer transport system component
MRRRLLVLCVASALAPVLSAPVAGADIFEPIQLASADLGQQADFAHHPAISGDGRYVAFDGSFGALSGVWRRDLLTGVVSAVVTCPKEGRAAGTCAELPSISDDGRYVSFTSILSLDPRNDTNSAPDVYVRDMNSSTPCAPEREVEACEDALASARNESTTGLSYVYGAEPSLEEGRYGAIASGRSALTADGRHVAFVTTATSDLHGPETPKLQVAVRDLDSHATRLVSVRYDAASRSTTEEPVPVTAQGLGAVYPGAGALPVFATTRAAFAGASISADGSTVAWMGQQIAQQAPLLGAEPNITPGYTEPLLRRIADGPLAPVRRITGGGDPASPACAASGEAAPREPPTLSDPCQGPFDPTYAQSEAGIWSLDPTVGDYLPQLSGDGNVAAFLSSAREIASGEAFSSEPLPDLYVADMRGSATRVQALRRLTELAGGNVGELSRTAPIADVGVSRDGSEVAFTTRRTVFPLGSPAFVSAPAAEAGASELFDVDLANDTLTRVTRGFKDESSEPASGVSGSPSFSADGNLLAFSSTAANLVYGDGNAAHGEIRDGFDGSDAFVTRRRVITPTPAETYVSPAPAGPALTADWRLYVTAHSRADGSVLLDVLVPASGTLGVHADSAVRVSLGSHAARRRARRHPRTTVVMRRVASARAPASHRGLAEVKVKLSRPYGGLANRRGGLSATAYLSFSAAGHALVRQSIEVSFVRVASAARRTRGHRRHGSSTRGRR